MRKYRLNEDRLPSKLPVRFSYKVFKTIKSIEKHNADNPKSLSNWFDYLNEVKIYISNRVIAWDYNSRHIRFPNGAFFIKDFDYNVGYTIKNNDQNQTYAYVFMMNLKTEEFGLKVPNVNESKRTITQKELKNIINECMSRCLRKYLKEQTNRVSLNENAQDRRVNNLIKQYYPMAGFNEIRNIRASFLNLIPNARARNEKWLCVVLEWFLKGEIPHEEYKRFNNYLGWLHKNTDPDKNYEGDWAIFTFNTIKQHYNQLFPSVKQIAPNHRKKQQENKLLQINGYTIRRIDTQAEASKLGNSVYNGEWCILDNLFEEQVDDCTCYIISNNKTYNKCSPMPLKNIIKQLKKFGYYNIVEDIDGLCEYNDVDVRNITEYSDEYFDIAYLDNGLPPYDKYGLSAIVVLVGQDGDLYGVYSRYNLPNMFDGCILSKMELSQLLGADIDTICQYVGR